MPATGLPDVKQKAIFDASEYVRGADETVIAALRMAQANRDAAKSFDDTMRIQIQAAAALAVSESGFRRLVSVQKELDDLTASVQKYTERTRELANAQTLFTAANENTVQGYRDIARIATASIGIQKQAQQEYFETVARVAQASRNIQVTALGEIAAEHVALGKQIESTGNSVEVNIINKAPAITRSINSLRKTVQGLSQDFEKVEKGVTSAGTRLGEALGPSAGGGFGTYDPLAGASRGSTFESLLPSIANAMRADQESRRFSSVIPSLLAGGGIAAIMSMLETPSVRGAIGNAARSAGNAAATAAGTAGAFINDTIGAGSGPTGGLGRAAVESAAVGAFIRRWYPVAHWVMMLSNELLATVGPATVAAGMGGLVGMQGGEQVIPRLKSVFATAESLGGSLGITAGQAMGLKTSPLQTAQNLATGAAFGLTGAVVNSLRAGAGNAFIQLGSNTVAMFSRFAATMTQEFQHNLGNQLGNIVSGGTGYLQQLGDVLGNIGHVFLNVAPNLPGVGGDLLSTLQGATGGLAAVTRLLGPALGPILSFEAGARWGPALVGGAARGLSIGSRGLLGTVARSAVAADVGTALNPATGAVVAREGEIIAGTGIAGALGGVSATTLGALAAGAFLLTKGATWKSPAQIAAAQTMQNINQMGFAQGVPAIVSAMQQAAAVPPGTAGAMTAVDRWQQGSRDVFKSILHGKPGAAWSGLTEAVSGGIGTIGDLLGFRTATPSNFQVAQKALQDLSSTMVNALGAGQRVANVWKGITGQTLDMSKAYDVATMAQLQLGNAFEKNGKLTGQAKQMIANLQAGYQAMNFTGGQFGAAVGAQTAMAGLQHSQIGAVNQAFDQLLQSVTGPAAAAAGFFGTLGGAPVATTRGGVRFAAPPAFRAMAQALTSFTTAQGAGAWNTFANQQTGLIAQLGNQTDQLRVMQTLGALSPGQTRQMTAFQMMQLLPMAQKSPAALAMLSTIGQEFGGPTMQGGMSQAQNFKNIADWTKQFAENAKTYNKNMNAGTVAASNIPRDAQQFVQQIGSNIAGDLASGITRHGADLQNKFMDSMLGGKGLDIGALRNYASFLANAGIPKAAGLDMAQQVARLSGAGSNAAIMNSIHAMITGAYATVKVNADISQAKSAIANLTHVTSQPKVTVKAEVAAAQAAINAIRGKDIPVNVRAQGIAAVEGAIAAIHGKTVTITINTVNRIITQLIGATTAPGGVAAATLVGGPAGMRLRAGAQTGMFVPGYGGGDIFPAMLEPGELVVPKHLVGSVAPILSGKIPGFAAGGGMGVMGFETMLQQAFHGEAVSNSMRQLVDMILGSEIQKFPRTVNVSIRPDGQGGNPASQGHDPNRVTGSPQQIAQAAAEAAAAVAKAVAAAAKGATGTQFGVEVIKGLTDGIKNAKGAARNAATAMMNHISQEIAYAKQTAQGLTQGLNFGGMDTTQGPVQTQMKSYADSLKTFAGDIKSMSKGGLNKDLLKQMIAAGPVQGDLLAQSIQQGPGGIKAVNDIYKQIQHLSKGIGAQAAGAVFGGTLAPNLKSGTFINNNVSVNISMSGHGDLGSLDSKELKQLMQKIQQELLKQAKRNRKTGVALKGKNA